MIRRDRFLSCLDRIGSARMLVIGPSVVEEDVHCAVTRLAPDRAVPVLLEEATSTHPGAAALTAITMAQLGASVTLASPVDADHWALRETMEAAGVRIIGGTGDSSPAPRLHRYVAGTRQMLQMRRHWSGPRTPMRMLLEKISLDDFDTALIVDALPAWFTPEDFQWLAQRRASAQTRLVFDAAGAESDPRPLRPDAIIVNEAESRQTARLYEAEDEDHVARLRNLVTKAAPAVLMTLGRQGAVSAAHNGQIEVAPITTTPFPFSDRRGVGFVLSGVYALMLTAGASAEEAGFLACGAATAAAASPGPKRIVYDDLLKIAYHEIESEVADAREVFDRIGREHLPMIDQAARALLQAYTSGRKVLIFGNGGSAAEANHLVTEMTGRFRARRSSLPAISLSSNDALATCIANDYGYEEIFAHQIEAFCKPGDIVIGMSTSGRSPNVIRAMERAREREAVIIAFTGEDAGPMRQLADLTLAVPSRSTPRIQEAHLFVIHVMCEMLDRRLDTQGRLQPSASEI